MCEMLMIQYPHMKGAPLVLGIPTNYDVFMISYPHTGGAPLICVVPTNQPRNVHDIIFAHEECACDISTRASDSCRTNQPRNHPPRNSDDTILIIWTLLNMFENAVQTYC